MECLTDASDVSEGASTTRLSKSHNYDTPVSLFARLVSFHHTLPAFPVPLLVIFTHSTVGQLAQVRQFL